MKLASFLSVRTIDAELKAADRKEALEGLSTLLFDAGLVPPGTDLVAILENREELGSTGIGKGVAIPHVRVKALENLTIAVGRSREGVDFQAVDGQPVHLFFLILAPESSPGTHLEALARISRLVKKPRMVERLLQAEGRDEMFTVIAAEDENGEER